MPESSSLLAVHFLNFKNQPLTINQWLESLRDHQFISVAPSNYLVVLLFLQFPFDNCHPTQLKKIYRQLFLVAHVLKEWCKYGSLNEITVKFLRLCLGNRVPIQVMLQNVINDTSTVDSKTVEKWQCIFAIVLELFNVPNMQGLSDLITLEQAILTNLIHPPKLSCISPSLSEFFGHPL